MTQLYEEYIIDKKTTFIDSILYILESTYILMNNNAQYNYKGQFCDIIRNDIYNENILNRLDNKLQQNIFYNVENFNGFLYYSTNYKIKK